MISVGPSLYDVLLDLTGHFLQQLIVGIDRDFDWGPAPPLPPLRTEPGAACTQTAQCWHRHLRDQLLCGGSPTSAEALTRPHEFDRLGREGSRRHRTQQSRSVCKTIVFLAFEQPCNENHSLHSRMHDYVKQLLSLFRIKIAARNGAGKNKKLGPISN